MFVNLERGGFIYIRERVVVGCIPDEERGEEGRQLNGLE
jgi:hypothetical protein